MATHGGNFEVYYSRQRVTHIICSNLPNAKIKALQKERSDLKPSTEQRVGILAFWGSLKEARA